MLVLLQNSGIINILDYDALINFSKVFSYQFQPLEFKTAAIQVLARFPEVPVTRCLRTAYAIPLNYEPVDCECGTGVPDVLHRMEIRRHKREFKIMLLK